MDALRDKQILVTYFWENSSRIEVYHRQIIEVHFNSWGN